MKTLIIIALLLIGCGKQAPRAQTPTVEDSSPFKVYMDRFKADAERFGRYPNKHDVLIRFYPLPETCEGIGCYFWEPESGPDNPVSSILIRQSWWDSASPVAREIAMYHLFGHRVLQRDHREDAENDPSVLAVMRFPFPSEESWTANREAYLEELFTYQGYKP